MLDIIVGSRDERFLPDLAGKLDRVTIGSVTVIDCEGHRLNHGILKTKLDQWLSPTL